MGLLFLGDSKLSALAIRAHLHHRQQHYLCPLALTGKTAEEMGMWIAAANDGTHPLQPIYVKNERGERKWLAEGYAFERPVTALVNGEEQTWTERVCIVRSLTYRQVHGIPGTYYLLSGLLSRPRPASRARTMA